MNLGRTLAMALSGLDGTPVQVEVFVSSGLPRFTITGLPDAACAQAPERVRAAITVAGMSMPQQRIAVNLSPASLPKLGSGFDLPIAIALLRAMKVLRAADCEQVMHLGELGLDGSLRPVPGVLPAVLAAAREGITEVVVPAANAREASLVEGVRVHHATTLRELVERYRAASGRGLPERDLPAPGEADGTGQPMPDLADVIGQHEARRAIELAAAGGHHLFLVGPPGSGKTMLAERMVSILPPLTPAQSLEVTAVRSVAGALEGEPRLCAVPPFVAPHHSASAAAMVGGGSGLIRPGAISLAHHGLLFLDEAPEFRSSVLQSLRQPIESGEVVVARARQAVRFPARFQLVMAANPCPCGQAVNKGLACTCTPLQRRSYLGRLSGPLMDRVDLQVPVPAVTRAALCSAAEERSSQVAARVVAAREAQLRRWGDRVPGGLNVLVPGSVLRSRPWRLPPSVTASLDRALDRGMLTLRGYDRVLRVAWTAADLAGRETPTVDDLGGALALRQHPGVAS